MITKSDFLPKRVSVENNDGTFTVEITPPKFFENKKQYVTLTEDQHERYKFWLKNKCLIQNMLPELSDDQREMILSGIGPEEWEELTNDEGC